MLLQLIMSLQSEKMLIMNGFFADDNTRVCLTKIPGDNGSDYINASYISVSAIL